MINVLLLDGPLRGQLAPWSETGSIAYDKPGGGTGLYLIHRCAMFCRELYVATCGPESGGGWDAAAWEFLASDMAKMLVKEERQPPEVRYVHSSDSAESGDKTS